MDIEARIGKLERSNRIWKGIVLACVGAVVMMGVAKNAPIDKLECEMLVVKDSNSDDAIVIGFSEAENETAGMMMFHIEGQQKPLIITSGTEGSMIHVGRTSIQENLIEIYAQGESSEPIVGIGEIRGGWGGRMELSTNTGEKAVVLSTIPRVDSDDDTHKRGSIALFDVDGYSAPVHLSPE